MIQVINNDFVVRKSKPIQNLRPLEIGIISTEGDFMDHVVMRTASTSQFEVMDLTDSGEDSCWTTIAGNPLIVEVVPPGYSISLDIYNEKI